MMLALAQSIQRRINMNSWRLEAWGSILMRSARSAKQTTQKSMANEVIDGEPRIPGLAGRK